MIDIKTLDNYSRYINLKQICDLADVSYSNVKHKVQRLKKGLPTQLNERESINLAREFNRLGIAFKKLKTFTPN